MSDRKFSKNKKKFKKYHQRWNKNQEDQHITEAQTSAQSNESDLPGFYFDPVKNRYFKIQDNYYGMESVVTNDSIKSKQITENMNKYPTNSNDKTNLLYYLNDLSLNGLNQNLRCKYQDFKVNFSKLETLFSISNITKVNVLFGNREIGKEKDIYLLVTQTSSSVVYKINLKNKTNSLVFIENTNPFEIDIGNPYERYSVLPPYIHNSSYLVLYDESFESSNRHGIRICQLKRSDTDRLKETCIGMKRFRLPMWCSALPNRAVNKCAVGLPNCAEVCDLIEDDSQSYKLNTNSSDVYCIKFSPDNDSLVYCGCRNRNVFGYDLRENHRRSNFNSMSKFEHKSCINDLVFKNSNYLYTNDFTGEISLWDIRANKVVSTYFDNIESNLKCSIKICPAGTYLYNICKDGCIRIWNTTTNKLVKRLQSPIPKAPHEIYSEIPSIDFLNDEKIFFYAIKEKLMLNDI